MPTPDDEATETAAADEPAATADSASVEAAGTSDSDDEDLPPPALIVRTREPDRPAAHTIGAPTREHAGLGAIVTFGLSVAGRTAERASVGATVRVKSKDNVLSLPHPQLSPLPTRVATTTSLDGKTSDGSRSEE